MTVKLSLAGETYAREIRTALNRISTATLGFRANPRGGTLDLATLPTFGARWLAPRLSGFIAAHPGITVNLATRTAPFDFAADQVDAAIHFGAPDWSGAELEWLMGEVVVPVCSPAIARRLAIGTPADLLGAPLLHQVSRPDAWERWFEAMGVAAASVHGMMLDQFATAAEAAAGDAGVALLPRFLIAAELSRGSLVEVVAGAVESEGQYYLAWPAARAAYAPLVAFRTWLRSAVAAS